MLNLLCRANLTLCPPICLCFIGMLRFRKSLPGMPMSLAALALEKNRTNQRSCCTRPGVEKRLSAKVSMLGRFLIVDLTFHEQLHMCQVRRRPSCSGSFAWLGSHPNLAAHKDATVASTIWAHIRTAKSSCVRITTLGQPPASRV